MRRWPTPLGPGLAPTPAVPLPLGWPHEQPREQRPTDQGDAIRPFNVAGGQAAWQVAPPFVTGNPQSDGAQLLCSFYVPRGHTGFVKGIKAAPFKPAFFYSSGFISLPARQSTASIYDIHPDPQYGFWRTPFGWETEFTDAGGGARGPAPYWRWHLRVLTGKIELVRSNSNLPPFSFGDPHSWFLVPNLAVPGRAYPAGFPGSAVGEWGAQRMQRIGDWEETAVHVPIPGGCTVCLFAEWTQLALAPRWFNVAAGGINNGTTIFPLGPSFGQLIGYTQPDQRAATQVNVRHGWAS